MGALGKTEDEHILVVAPQRVRARAERQSFGFAEEAHRKVVVAEAAVRRQRDLVRPLPIHHGFGELSLAVDHASISAWSPPALTRRHERKDKAGRGAAGGVGSLYQNENKKGTKISKERAPCGGSKAPGAPQGE